MTPEEKQDRLNKLKEVESKAILLGRMFFLAGSIGMITAAFLVSPAFGVSVASIIFLILFAVMALTLHRSGEERKRLEAEVKEDA